MNTMKTGDNMQLSRCTRIKPVTILTINSKQLKKRLECFGFYLGKTILNTGFFLHEYQIVISCDRLLAIPIQICKEIEI